MATIKQICEVLKAHEEGKTVQMKNKKGDWVDVPDFHKWQIGTPLQTNKELRVKPVPLEVWIVYPSAPSEPKVFHSYGAALGWCSDFTATIRRFREVPDESE